MRFVSFGHRIVRGYPKTGRNKVVSGDFDKKLGRPNTKTDDHRRPSHQVSVCTSSVLHLHFYFCVLHSVEMISDTHIQDVSVYLYNLYIFIDIYRFS